MELLRVLFLAANPPGPSSLDVGSQLRAIRENLKLAADRIQLSFEAAAQADDLQPSLLKTKPHIVHLSLRGRDDGSMELLAPDGGAAPVTKEWLVTLFQLLEVNVRVVVLNVCHSAAAAAELAQHIECAIGVNGSIDDLNSITYIGAFYGAIALGQSVQKAHDLGRHAIARTDQRAVMPDLKLKEGVDAEAIVLLPEDCSVVPTHDARPIQEPPLHKGAPKSPGAGVAVVVDAGRGRWKPALVIVPCIAIGAAALLWPSQPPASSGEQQATGMSSGIVAPPSRPSSPPVPSPTRTPDGKEGVLFTGRWLESETGRKFCESLRRDDDRLDVQCAPLWGSDDLRRTTRDLGIQVIVEVETAERAVVWSRAHEEGGSGGNLFAGDIHIAIDQSTEARARAFIRALARVSSSKPSFVLDKCPVTREDPVDELTLAALLTIPACGQPTTIEPQKLLEPCEGKGDGTALCAEARFLYAVRCPACPDARDQIKLVAPEGSDRPANVPLTLWDAARVKSGRLACRANDAAGTADPARKLNESPRACIRAAAAELAACALRLDPSGSAQLASIEAQSLEAESGSTDENDCPPHTVGGIAGERGYQRLLAGRWREAAADYGLAWHLRHEPVYGVGQAEALLHANQDDQAEKILDGLGGVKFGDDKRSEVYAALLGWVLAKRRGGDAPVRAARKLVDVYATQVSQGENATDPKDQDIRKLACTRSRPPCVVDVLAEPRRDTSVRELATTLNLDPPR